ncbi:hydrogenase expression/formation protein HypE [Streptomyces sp. TRM68367]|uniref:hydrogenase expression/formation protein HypE n=1 Tax=Streptomyces sp. TRM68367 TaxID=2758415 RepID=UPI00165CD9CF|nr:hydrogenase expression/formation protein HypE [Streptomyces sp. TRM68367]MBC9726538.1 hydrogenase expression/formation protein HypE [Streptomyces sp. TRM68367]
MSPSVTDTDTVILDHGTGARRSRELVELISATLGDVYIGEMEDSAILTVDGAQIAVTTDSFVVDPVLFGNGDIGKIAVCGTVNDLAVAGAEPRYLTLGMILEDGLPLSTLVRVLTSIRDTAKEAGVVIVAGDTKVVRKGEADQIYLNTTGVGVFKRPPLRMRDVQPGDKVILSGPIGNHTVHLLSIREGLGFETRVLSDCAPLNGMLADVFEATGGGTGVHSIRDVTRGGLNAVLNEYAATVGTTVLVDEQAIPVQPETAMAMDMLGISPLNAANEGCACLFVAPSAAEAVLEALRSHSYGAGAVVIGEVTDEPTARVQLQDANGRRETLDELAGAELPRLC